MQLTTYICQNCGNGVLGKPYAYTVKKFCNSKCNKEYRQKNFGNFFWAKIKIGYSNECWEWQASKVNGYGRLNLNGHLVLAHRMAYILTYGGITEGMFVCHKCDNRPCCNPNHLWLGSHKENMDDRDKKGRQYAARGEANHFHKFSEKEVKEIRVMFATGLYTRLQLSQIFNCSQSQITKIVGYRAWKNV